MAQRRQDVVERYQIDDCSSSWREEGIVYLDTRHDHLHERSDVGCSRGDRTIAGQVIERLRHAEAAREGDRRRRTSNIVREIRAGRRFTLPWLSLAGFLGFKRFYHTDILINIRLQQKDSSE
jgi:hypothetical protein